MNSYLAKTANLPRKIWSLSTNRVPVCVPTSVPASGPYAAEGGGGGFISPDKFGPDGFGEIPFRNPVLRPLAVLWFGPRHVDGRIQAAREKAQAMIARIYRPAKTAMQSGRGRARKWVLEFEPETARTLDPLMGWTSSADTRGQVKLSFESKNLCVAYAEKHGIAYDLHDPTERSLNIRAYADNFT